MRLGQHWTIQTIVPRTIVSKETASAEMAAFGEQAEGLEAKSISMGSKKISASLACAHREPSWSTNPEIVRFVNRLATRYCIVCLDWIRERDRLKFVKYVRAALAEGKNEFEVARELGLEGTADPFAPPARQTYFQILLLNSGYSIKDHSLQRANHLPDK